MSTKESNTGFIFPNYLTLKNSTLKLRSTGYRKKLMITIYGLSFYDTDTNMDVINCRETKAILIKMYRSFSVDKILGGMLNSVKDRCQESTLKDLENLSEKIKENYESFPYKEELLMMFDFKDDSTLYLFKSVDGQYVEIAHFNDVEDLMTSILKCYFDNKSATPSLINNLV